MKNYIRHRSFLNKKIFKLVFYIAVFYIVVFTALKLNIFLNSDALVSFRIDNFWSYSSLIFRRGLNGELIYRLDLLTNYGIYLFSILIWSLFVYFLIISMNQMKTTLKSFDLLLFLISPLFLLYKVDSEIFTLLPFITLFHTNKNLQLWGTLFLIFIATLLKEISILFYAPVMLYFFIHNKIHVKIIIGLLFLSLAFFLIFPKPLPTFLLENGYWLDKGISLKESHLYSFVSMSFSDVLVKHIGYISSSNYLFLFPLLFFMLFMLSLYYQRTRSVIATFYLFFITMLCFIMTVDYGRYFYLFIFYALLSSHPKTSKYFSFTNFNLIVINKSVSKISEAFFTKLWNLRYFILTLLVLSPSGFWVKSYQARPRFYVLLSENPLLTTIYNIVVK